MSDIVQVVLAVVLFLVVLFVANRVRTARMVKARDVILEDFRRRGALSPETAVPLGYAQSKILNVGLRDERPRVLREMIRYGVVDVTEDKRYFLNEEAFQQLVETVSRKNVAAESAGTDAPETKSDGEE